MHIYCPQHLLCVSTLPCRNNIVRFLCCLKMKFAHKLCWQTTKKCQLHKTVLISLQAMSNMFSSQPEKKYKILFGWDFTKLYQFNIKQIEMCRFFWGHPVHVRLRLVYTERCLAVIEFTNIRAHTSATTSEIFSISRQLSPDALWYINHTV